MARPNEDSGPNPEAVPFCLFLRTAHYSCHLDLLIPTMSVVEMKKGTDQMCDDVLKNRESFRFPASHELVVFPCPLAGVDALAAGT